MARQKPQKPNSFWRITWPSRRRILKQITLHWWKWMNCGHSRCMHLNGKTFQCVYYSELAYIFLCTAVAFPHPSLSLFVLFLHTPLFWVPATFPVHYWSLDFQSNAKTQIRHSNNCFLLCMPNMLPHPAQFYFYTFLLLRIFTLRKFKQVIA